MARTLDVPANRISQLLNGKRSITADTALRLGHWLGTSPELWLNLQRQYDLPLAESVTGQEIRSTVVPLDRSSMEIDQLSADKRSA